MGDREGKRRGKWDMTGSRLRFHTISFPNLISLPGGARADERGGEKKGKVYEHRKKRGERGRG